MNLFDFLNVTQADYDTYDTEIDAVVTVCYSNADKDNYDNFCSILYTKVSVIKQCDENVLVVNWSALIKKNWDKFKAFTKENWHHDYKDDSEFTYQWINEINSYLAGYVSESFYADLYAFVNTLEGV